jgi:hypothetical protein
MPNGTSNYFSDCNKATESSRVLGHLTGRCPSQLEPNVNSQSKTVLSVELCRGYPCYWSHAQASFVLFLVEKILGSGLVNKLGK